MEWKTMGNPVVDIAASSRTWLDWTGLQAGLQSNWYHICANLPVKFVIKTPRISSNSPLEICPSSILIRNSLFNPNNLEDPVCLRVSHPGSTPSISFMENLSKLGEGMKIIRGRILQAEQSQPSCRLWSAVLDLHALHNQYSQHDLYNLHILNGLHYLHDLPGRSTTT